MPERETRARRAALPFLPDLCVATGADDRTLRSNRTVGEQAQVHGHVEAGARAQGSSCGRMSVREEWLLQASPGTPEARGAALRLLARQGPEAWA